VRRRAKAPSATAAASTGTTRARRTMFGLACLCVLGLVAFVGSSAPSVGAAESFPGQGFLPNNRAWEMVSPPDKNGGNVTPFSQKVQSATDGDATTFSSLVSFGDVRGSTFEVDYMSRRDARPGTNGWSTHAITPRQNSLSLENAVLLGITATYEGDYSPDLSKAVIRSGRPPLTDAPNVADVSNLYLREDLSTPGAGSYRLLTDSFAPISMTPIESAFFGRSRLDGTSADFSHVVYESTLGLVEGTSVGPQKLYENVAGDVRLLGRIPYPVRSLTVSATAGTFTLSVNGESTDAIPFDAPASVIESDLDALPSVSGSGGDVTVTGGPGSSDGSAPYLLVFNASLAASANLDLSSDPSALSGGGASAEVGVDPRSYSCDDAGGPAVACVPATASQAGIPAFERKNADGMISDDGSRIFFQAPLDGLFGGTIYLREDGVRTLQLNASEKDPLAVEAPQKALLWEASRDGSRAFFTTSEGLIEGDDDGIPDLYMYEMEKPEGERLTLLSGGGDPLAEVQGVVGASDDGHYVYFLAAGQLVAGEPPVERAGLYLWHDGDVSYIGSIDGAGANSGQAVIENSTRASSSFPEETKTSRVSPDGRRLLFMSEADDGLKGRGGFAGYDQLSKCHAHNGPGFGCRELYLYDADSGQLRCASCNPSGAPATSEAWGDVIAKTGIGAIIGSSHLSNTLSDDVRYVFFSSADRLVSEDTNGTYDAYVYDTQSEEPHLLSSGEDKKPSYFMDASADGSDVFFATSEQLSRWDIDTSYDLYDARVGGGLPEPVPPPPSCQGDACQPTPRQLNDPTPASSTFRGARNPTASRCPKGKRRVKTRAKSRCVKRKQHKRAAKHNRRAGR
jgi:hypothetical protein